MTGKIPEHIPKIHIKLGGEDQEKFFKGTIKKEKGETSAGKKVTRGSLSAKWNRLGHLCLGLLHGKWDWVNNKNQLALLKKSFEVFGKDWKSVQMKLSETGKQAITRGELENALVEANDVVKMLIAADADKKQVAEIQDTLVKIANALVTLDLTDKPKSEEPVATFEGSRHPQGKMVTFDAHPEVRERPSKPPPPKASTHVQLEPASAPSQAHVPPKPTQVKTDILTPPPPSPSATLAKGPQAGAAKVPTPAKGVQPTTTQAPTKAPTPKAAAQPLAAPHVAPPLLHKPPEKAPSPTKGAPPPAATRVPTPQAKPEEKPAASTATGPTGLPTAAELRAAPRPPPRKLAERFEPTATKPAEAPPAKVPSPTRSTVGDMVAKLEKPPEAPKPPEKPKGGGQVEAAVKAREAAQQQPAKEVPLTQSDAAALQFFSNLSASVEFGQLITKFLTSEAEQEEVEFNATQLKQIFGQKAESDPYLRNLIGLLGEDKTLTLRRGQQPNEVEVSFPPDVRDPGRSLQLTLLESSAAAPPPAAAPRGKEKGIAKEEASPRRLAPVKLMILAAGAVVGSFLGADAISRAFQGASQGPSREDFSGMMARGTLTRPPPAEPPPEFSQVVTGRGGTYTQAGAVFPTFVEQLPEAQLPQFSVPPPSTTTPPPTTKAPTTTPLPKAEPKPEPKAEPKPEPKEAPKAQAPTGAPTTKTPTGVPPASAKGPTQPEAAGMSTAAKVGLGIGALALGAAGVMYVNGKPVVPPDRKKVIERQARFSLLKEICEKYRGEYGSPSVSPSTGVSRLRPFYETYANQVKQLCRTLKKESTYEESFQKTSEEVMLNASEKAFLEASDEDCAKFEEGILDALLGLEQEAQAKGISPENQKMFKENYRLAARIEAAAKFHIDEMRSYQGALNQANQQVMSQALGRFITESRTQLNEAMKKGTLLPEDVAIKGKALRGRNEELKRMQGTVNTIVKERQAAYMEHLTATALLRENASSFSVSGTGTAPITAGPAPQLGAQVEIPAAELAPQLGAQGKVAAEKPIHMTPKQAVVLLKNLRNMVLQGIKDKNMRGSVVEKDKKELEVIDRLHPDNANLFPAEMQDAITKLFNVAETYGVRLHSDYKNVILQPEAGGIKPTAQVKPQAVPTQEALAKAKILQSLKSRVLEKVGEQSLAVEELGQALADLRIIDHLKPENPSEFDGQVTAALAGLDKVAQAYRLPFSSADYHQQVGELEVSGRPPEGELKKGVSEAEAPPVGRREEGPPKPTLTLKAIREKQTAVGAPREREVSPEDGKPQKLTPTQTGQMFEDAQATAKAAKKPPEDKPGAAPAQKTEKSAPQFETYHPPRAVPPPQTKTKRQASGQNLRALQDAMKGKTREDQLQMMTLGLLGAVAAPEEQAQETVPAMQIRQREIAEEQSRLEEKIEEMVLQHPELKPKWKTAKEDYIAELKVLHEQHSPVTSQNVSQLEEGILQLTDELREKMKAALREKLGTKPEAEAQNNPTSLERYQKTIAVQIEIGQLKENLAMVKKFGHKESQKAITNFNHLLDQNLKSINPKAESFRDLDRDQLDQWIAGAREIAADQKTAISDGTIVLPTPTKVRPALQPRVSSARGKQPLEPTKADAGQPAAPPKPPSPARAKAGEGVQPQAKPETAEAVQLKAKVEAPPESDAQAKEALLKDGLGRTSKEINRITQEKDKLDAVKEDGRTKQQKADFTRVTHENVDFPTNLDALNKQYIPGYRPPNMPRQERYALPVPQRHVTLMNEEVERCAKNLTKEEIDEWLKAVRVLIQTKQPPPPPTAPTKAAPLHPTKPKSPPDTGTHVPPPKAPPTEKAPSPKATAGGLEAVKEPVKEPAKPPSPKKAAAAPPLTSEPSKQAAGDVSEAEQQRQKSQELAERGKGVLIRLVDSIRTLESAIEFDSQAGTTRPRIPEKRLQQMRGNLEEFKKSLKGFTREIGVINDKIKAPHYGGFDDRSIPKDDAVYASELGPAQLDLAVGHLANVSVGELTQWTEGMSRYLGEVEKLLEKERQKMTSGQPKALPPSTTAAAPKPSVSEPKAKEVGGAEAAVPGLSPERQERTQQLLKRSERVLHSLRSVIDNLDEQILANRKTAREVGADPDRAVSDLEKRKRPFEERFNEFKSHLLSTTQQIIQSFKVPEVPTNHAIKQVYEGTKAYLKEGALQAGDNFDKWYKEVSQMLESAERFIDTEQPKKPAEPEASKAATASTTAATPAKPPELRPMKKFDGGIRKQQEERREKERAQETPKASTTSAAEAPPVILAGDFTPQEIEKRLKALNQVKQNLLREFDRRGTVGLKSESGLEALKIPDKVMSSAEFFKLEKQCLEEMDNVELTLRAFNEGAPQGPLPTTAYLDMVVDKAEKPEAPKAAPATTTAATAAKDPESAGPAGSLPSGLTKEAEILEGLPQDELMRKLRARSQQKSELSEKERAQKPPEPKASEASQASSTSAAEASPEILPKEDLTPQEIKMRLKILKKLKQDMLGEFNRSASSEKQANHPKDIVIPDSFESSSKFLKFEQECLTALDDSAISLREWNEGRRQWKDKVGIEYSLPPPGITPSLAYRELIKKPEAPKAAPATTTAATPTKGPVLANIGKDYPPQEIQRRLNALAKAKEKLIEEYDRLASQNFKAESDVEKIEIPKEIVASAEFRKLEISLLREMDTCAEKLRFHLERRKPVLTPSVSVPRTVYFGLLSNKETSA